MATVGLDLSTTLNTRRPLARVRSRKLILGSFVCALLAPDAATINAKTANFRIKGQRILGSCSSEIAQPTSILLSLWERAGERNGVNLRSSPSPKPSPKGRGQKLNPNPADCDKPCPCPFPRASLPPETFLPASDRDPCASSALERISVRASVSACRDP